MGDIRINDQSLNQKPCSIKEFVSVEKDPEKTVDYFYKVLDEDIKANKSLRDFRLLKYFKRLPEKDRVMIGKYVDSKYFKDKIPYFDIILPPGKICLAEKRDEINSLRPDNYSPEQLLMRIYSAKSAPKDRALPILNSKFNIDNMAAYDSHTQQILLAMKNHPPMTKKRPLIAGKGKNQIVFLVPEDIKIGRQEYLEIMQIYSMVKKINDLFPKNKVIKVSLERGQSGECLDNNEIIVGINDRHILKTTAHEMGHAVFKTLFEENSSKMSKDSTWQRIYYLSLGFGNFEITDDSSYEGCGDSESGHPYDNPDELFASSFMIYLIYGDEFIKNIKDPDTPQSTKKVGNLLFTYMKNRVFNGRMFCKGNIPDIALKIDDDEIMASLSSSLKDKNNCVQLAGAKAISELGIKDNRLMAPLLSCLNSWDFSVTEKSSDTIIKLNDKRFIAPLIRMLENEKNDRGLRIASMRILGKLKDSSAISPLKKALKDKDQNIRAAAAEALKNLGK